jgi:MFS family permease
LSRLVNRSAVVSLLLARIVYAVNWYNIGSIFSFLAVDFGENVSGLGILTGSFYLGLGLGQVPGGVVAAKVGPRKTAIYGTTIASLACLLSGLASEFSQIAVLRLIAGVGMAFVFAPGVALIAKHFGQGAEGLGIGVYNAMYYVGGAVGLFGWAVFAGLLGWRLSLESSGLLGLITGVIMLLVLPKDNVSHQFSIKPSTLVDVLTNGSLILLGAELFIITGGASLVTAIMIYYMEQRLLVGSSLAGLIAGLAPILALVGSLLAGRNYDRRRQASRMIFFSGFVMAIGLMLASITTIYAATLSTLIVGFCSGAGATAGFSAAREVRGGDEYEALAVGWVNSLQLYSGFVWPIIFSFIVVHSDYLAAWLVAGLFTLLVALGTRIWRIRTSSA